MTKPNSAPTLALDPETVADQDGLLPKQAKFVVEYLLSGNATQAAILAGYTPKNAAITGCRNLRKANISAVLSRKQQEIAQRQVKRLEEMELTEARVNRETARIAFFDPRKLFNADGSPKQVTDLDDDTAAAISGIDVVEEFAGSGPDRVLIGYTKKYKIADKNAALERAAKLLTMYGKEPEPKQDSLTVLLMSISSGTHSTFLPVLEDPEHG